MTDPRETCQCGGVERTGGEEWRHVGVCAHQFAGLNCDRTDPGACAACGYEPGHCPNSCPRYGGES